MDVTKDLSAARGWRWLRAMLGIRRHSRGWWMVLALAGVGLPVRASDVVVLPDYEVSAAVLAAMIPRDQLRDICREARPFHRSFDLSAVTFLKAPASRFTPAPRCFVRARDGHILQEITDATLTFRVTENWDRGFLSSNQPEQFAAFYLMLRPRWPGPAITIGAVDQLLHDYVQFAEQRFQDAIRHYGAAGAWCIDLRWQTVPDEVDFIARSSAAAARIGQRLGVAARGRVVRASAAALANAAMTHGAGYVAAAASDIDAVTPWRSTAGLPPVRDHAALIRVGWVQYREGDQPPRTDYVGLLLDPAPGKGESPRPARGLHLEGPVLSDH